MGHGVQGGGWAKSDGAVSVWGVTKHRGDEVDAAFGCWGDTFVYVCT